MEYVFYPDVFWVSNFIMDFLVLLLVRYLKKSRSRIRRIFLSCAVGATISTLLFLSLPQFEIYQLAVHFLLNPVMLLIAFPIKGIRIFWRDFFLTYVTMLLLGGVLGWLWGTYGQWKNFWLCAAAAAGICFWILHGVKNRRREQQTYEILLLTGSRSLKLLGFLDTGNLLTDPFVHQPVHILQEELLQEELAEEKLSLRYIPFHSIGQEQGLLPVVTLKAMYIRKSGETTDAAPIYLEKPVFGLAKEKLFQKQDYQVILNAGGISV